MDEFGQNDFPTYGKVEEIIIWEEEKILLVEVLKTIEFCPLMMAYKVSPTHEISAIFTKNLPWPGVFNIINKNGGKMIVDISSIEDPEIVVEERQL